MENAAEIAKVLIANRADVNARAKIYGFTPLHTAELNNSADVAKLLRDNGGTR